MSAISWRASPWGCLDTVHGGMVEEDAATGEASRRAIAFRPVGDDETKGELERLSGHLVGHLEAHYEDTGVEGFVGHCRIREERDDLAQRDAEIDQRDVGDDGTIQDVVGGFAARKQRLYAHLGNTRCGVRPEGQISAGDGQCYEAGAQEGCSPAGEERKGQGTNSRKRSSRKDEGNTIWIEGSGSRLLVDDRSSLFRDASAATL